MQQGDVLLYQQNDGGDITVTDGLVQMSGGLETAVYLCLFGGNEQDDGRSDNPQQFWGNHDEPLNNQQRSETQFLLNSLPPIPINLRRVEEAVKRDLQRLLDTGAVSSATASADLTAPQKIKITVECNAEGVPEKFEFYENWRVEI